MSKRDQALYELANLTLSRSVDDRMFDSIDTLAGRTTLSRSTVGRAVQHFCDVGAAEWTVGTKVLKLCSKHRAVDIYKTTWSRKQSLVGHITEAAASKLAGSGDAVWGGMRAAIEHMDGFVPSSPHTASIYVTDPAVIAALDEGVIPVYRWVTDSLPEGGYATVAQTLTELFNTPGWVAGDFYQALWDRCVSEKR